MNTIRPKDRPDLPQPVRTEAPSVRANGVRPERPVADRFGAAQEGTVLPVDPGERAEADLVEPGAFRLGSQAMLGLRETLPFPGLGGDEGLTPEEAEARVRADGDFQELSPEVQEEVIATITNPELEPEGRETLVKIVTSGEFGYLSDEDAIDFLNYAGNTIDGHGEAIREDIAEHLASDEYRHPTFLGNELKGKAKDFFQARELMQIVRGQEALPHSTPVDELPPAERDVTILSGPEEVEDYDFDSGEADAVKYVLDVDGEEVEVYFPAEEVENQPTLEELEAMIESMPDELASELSTIVIETKPKASGASASVGSDEVIRIWPNENRSVARLASTLNHEVAHIIANDAWGHDSRVDRGEDPEDVLSEGWQDWAEADGTYVSDYAQNSATGDNKDDQVKWGEDFSETVELYLQVRGTEDEAEFAELYPNRYAILQEMFGDD